MKTALVWLLFGASIATAQDDDGCLLCADGSNATGSFPDGSPCSDYKYVQENQQFVPSTL